MPTPPFHDDAEAVVQDDLAALELRVARYADSLSPFYGSGREKDAERWDRATREIFGLPGPGNERGAHEARPGNPAVARVS